MGRRNWAAVCALLVVLAGCSALPTGNGTAPEIEETLTPAPVVATGADAAPTPASSVAFPPGVSRAGTVDPDLIFRAHVESLANRSYTWVYRKTERSNRSGTVTGTTRVAVDDDAALVANRGFRSGMHNTLYLTRQRGYIRWTSGDGTEYSVRDATVADREHSFVGYSLRTFIPENGVETSVVEWQGRQYIRLYVQPQPPPSGLAEELVDSTLVWGYTLTAYVSPAGRVRMLAVEYDDLRAHVSWRFDYRAVGETTVRKPDWISKVRTGTNRTDGTVTVAGE
jgi:hypothetical protein